MTSTGGAYAWSGGTIAGAGTVTFASALAISGSVSLGVHTVWFALAITPLRSHHMRLLRADE